MVSPLMLEITNLLFTSSFDTDIVLFEKLINELFSFSFILLLVHFCCLNSKNKILSGLPISDTVILVLAYPLTFLRLSSTIENRV
jgi:hypothetical protein